MAAINDVTKLKIIDGVAVLILDSPPVNALSQQVRAGLLEGIKQAVADPTANAIVISCRGKTFIAGADITEFGKPPQAPSLPEVQAAIENSPKPVVAAIHGTALGGGLEVALTCHYRVAIAAAKCGLPEVKLGLLPGAGGTQRLPRLVGVERALKMVTSGEHVSAQECHKLGLIDEVVDEFDLEGNAIAFAKTVVAAGRPLRKVRDVNEKVETARGNTELFANFRRVNARKFRGFKAPEFNIQCIEAAIYLPFDEGLQLERKLFLELMSGSQSAAQRHVFFAEREVWKIPDVGGHTPIIAINKVGIIGAGTMGGGIAMNFLNVGMPVTIVETKQDALDRGLSTVRRNYENTAKRGKVTMADVEKRMSMLTPTLSLDDLAHCDLVIEAVFENMEVKKEIFAKLDRICKPGAILATNTSALNIDEIATAVKRPDAVIGLHFFSPANVMRLLEVVRAKETSKAVIATSMQLAKRIGKVAALVGVCPGFVGNRMLAARSRAAQSLLLEGVMPWDIDRVLYDFGLPMGPFAMSDLAGLDIGWSKETSKSSTIREILCEMDRRGQKTNAGYYDYDETRTARPSPVVEKIVKDFVAKHQASASEPRAISPEEILERCLYPMINEGAKILEEGKAIRASDIDIVWINGYGWPVYRGGPMWYGDHMGLDNVLAKLRQYEGPNFQPAALLERLASEGKKFKDLPAAQ
ncbi:MAG TPA: 3-hydroxyacyl-CoA dehydrogenase NAD-binding domain-containing protein [Steroidobacteraceae bacterium]|nr:3-hydroxyacyl-CoA dehydrogenase NAD-binding domain-containing protein [Steroidobacteraceae bacterium]